MEASSGCAVGRKLQLLCADPIPVYKTELVFYLDITDDVVRSVFISDEYPIVFSFDDFTTVWYVDCDVQRCLLAESTRLYSEDATLTSLFVSSRFLFSPLELTRESQQYRICALAHFFSASVIVFETTRTAHAPV